MIFFLFVAAQAHSSRQAIPLEVISLILRRRWKKARLLGQPLPASRTVCVSFPYFGVCLFSASVHYSQDAKFFWGLCLLLGWALWSQRSRRFTVAVWAGSLVTALALGYAGQRGVSELVRYIDSFNPQMSGWWLEWFRTRGFDPSESKTMLGQVGRVKASGKIVIRVATENTSPPSLLRAASYRSYGTGQTWHSGLEETDYQNVPEAGFNSYDLIPGKSNLTTVNISCYLSGGRGLLPVPAGCGRLDNFWLASLQRSQLGALLAEGPGLAVFDARYGPGATIDSPADTNLDLLVPAKEIPALEQVIDGLHLNGQPFEEALRTINGFFVSNFNYSVWQGLANVRSNETVLSRFLLRSKSGHCEYFATSTVLLLRQIHIPARYAVGYAVHEGSGSKYVVRERDAHAWCLVWDQRSRRWRDFDTTPASWVDIESDRASPLQFLSDFWSRISFELSRLRWGQSNLRQYVLWALLPVLALLLYQIIWRSRRRRQRRDSRQAELALVCPGLDSEFYQLERLLQQRAVPRRPSEPLSGWLVRAVGQPGLAEIQAPLQALLRLHYRYRFDPRGLDPDERERLRREVRACLGELLKARQ
jgi:protein-glutamine gamma-glutamyltransferase